MALTLNEEKLLAKTVKLFPVLYNKHIPGYRNNDVVYYAWGEVAAKLEFVENGELYIYIYIYIYAGKTELRLWFSFLLFYRFQFQIKNFVKLFFIKRCKLDFTKDYENLNPLSAE